MGYGVVNGFMDHLYTPLGITSNHSATPNLYRLPQHPLSLTPACCVFNGRSLATFSFPLSRCYCPATIPQLNACQLSTQLYRHLFSASLEKIDSTTSLHINSFIHQPTTSFHFTQLNCTESELYYDRRSVGQSVLEQSTHLGLSTRFFYVR
jgi:hypothetical protein